MQYEVKIGLEVHAQLLTVTKIFCGCSAKFGALPNTNVCPVCLGMPGSLPMLNKKVVDFAIRVALATNCRVEKECVWARKNYFYPDLPKNYQISQYEEPLAQFGFFYINGQSEGKKEIKISRIHMEEDAGRLIHNEIENLTFVDYNRAGVPLVEIVTAPDISTSWEAKEYLKALKNLLVYLEVNSGGMEEGAFRCDVNVSLKPFEQKELGTKVELKNINSFRNVEKALEYEIYRQKMILENKGIILQETRLWDVNVGKTISMRDKENAHDYRYFPEPDLPIIYIGDDWIEEIRMELPELPQVKKERFEKEYSLSSEDAEMLVVSKELSSFFEETVKVGVNAKLASNWIKGDFINFLKSKRLNVKDSRITPFKLAELLKYIEKDVLSNKMAKEILIEMFLTGFSAKDIIKEKGVSQISNVEELKMLLEDLFLKYPNEVLKLKEGKQKLMSFFIGKVMQETKGKANPKILNVLILESLNL